MWAMWLGWLGDALWPDPQCPGFLSALDGGEKSMPAHLTLGGCSEGCARLQVGDSVSSRHAKSLPSSRW